MNNKYYLDTEFASQDSHLTTDNHGSDSYSASILSGSQHFMVAGGTFTSITNNHTFTPSQPADLRTIAFGDIYLQEEIGLTAGPRTVERLPERGSVRRIYSARVMGFEGNMTVAMYHGDGAEEEWRKEITKYMSIRHPTILQVCGMASSNNMHAVIFHDHDLVPFSHFVELYRYSPLLTVYIYAYCAREFKEAKDFFQSAFRQSLYERRCTIWIRRSTGGLCAELMPPSSTIQLSYHLGGVQRCHGIKPLDAPNQKAMIIDCLSLRMYHEICYWDLSQTRTITISADATVNLGTVAVCPSGNQFEGSAKTTFLPDLKVDWGDWRGAQGDIMQDGWTRCNSDDVLSSTLSVHMWCYACGQSWLSQANHISSHLQVNFENHVLMEHAYFILKISGTKEAGPPGYLFLCPVKDLQTGPSSFRWSNCPAYWSLDPSGVDRLSAENATGLGFPSIQLMIKAKGDCWDANAYDGLREFHRAKGFDPYSQDVARHLGYPLYQISAEPEAPLAHVVVAEHSC